MKNAFNETKMKNMWIDQFQSLKWRNGLYNQVSLNLREKLSKINPFRNFDFLSKLNAKSKSMIWSKSMINKSQWAIQPGRFRVSESDHGSTAKTLTSSYDVVLTRIRANVDQAKVAFVDIIRWRHGWQHRKFRRVAGAWRRSRNPGGACNTQWPPDFIGL